MVDEFASGGRVDEGDFLSNALYGVQVNRAAPVQGNTAYNVPQRRASDRSSSGGGSGGYSGGSGLEGLQKEIFREQLKKMQAPLQEGDPGWSGRRFNPAEEKWKIANTPSGYGPGFDQMRREQALQFIGAGGQGGAGAAHGFATGSVAQDLMKQEAAQGRWNATRAQMTKNPYGGTFTGQSQPQEKAEGGYVMDTDQWDDGGQVNGPSFPPDRVHVMAQGGEGVLPLDMMDRLKKYKSDDPMLNEIKGLLFDPNQKQKFAGGGGINMGELIKSGTGMDYSSLVGQGAKEYPNVPAGSQHHALGAEKFTRKLSESIGDIPAFALAQLAGLGVEGYEYLAGDPSSLTGATLRDLGGNFAGGMRAISKGPQKKAHGGQVKLSTGQIDLSKPNYTHKTPEGQFVGPKSPYIYDPSPGSSKVSVRKKTSFSNTDLDKYQTPTSQGVDSGIDIDSEIERASLNRANEERRAALYSSLVATSGPAVRAKMAGLINQARGLAMAEDEKIKGFMGKKAEIEAAKAQREAVAAQNKAELGISQQRVNVQQQGVNARLAELKTQMAPEQFEELLKQFQLGQYSPQE
jgi:hypothetical protein